MQTFEENLTLEGILGELILPAVKSKELALREKGLISLGLCCLIAKVKYCPARLPSAHVVHLA
jgi:condensin complex subunit 3